MEEAIKTASSTAMPCAWANAQAYLLNELVSRQLISSGELERCADLQQESGVPLAIMLVRLGLIADTDMATMLHEACDLPLLDKNNLPQVPLHHSHLSRKFLQDSFILPLEETDNELVVAMADPLDAFARQALELACQKRLHIYVGSLTQIENAIEKIYGEGNSKFDDIVDAINIVDDSNHTESTERLRDLAEEAPIIRIVSLIINRALELRASDIHIEPFENRLKLRYRVDGVLQEADAPPVKSTAAIISRIKIMAKLNIAEHRLPQDGRIQIRTQGKLIDLRVSTVPTLHGESVVLRILDKQQLALDFDRLGFTDYTREEFRKVLRMPHGIVLVTGPTGSGKTTTLYTALKELNSPDRKILTVEDPVEYQLEGINQIQVKPKIGLNFADALRSIVRQDPDVIMIGEMRDLETASIAVQSALTGHLVFSTLHTNDAGSSVTRLLDMGVEDYLLTSTLNGILSQRLVRTLCAHCREAYRPLPELIEELNLARHAGSTDITLFKPGQCEHCSDTGYQGRLMITELLTLNEKIRRLILAHADGNRIQAASVDAGMDTMQIDGIKKALLGKTTIEEVMRVTKQV